MENYSGKNAVITGAASGLGFALAESLVKQGANVLMVDIEAGALDSAAEQLRAIATGKVLTQITDVSSASAMQALAGRAQREFNAIHLLCNNAGVISASSLWESSIDEYQWVMGVNLWGIIHSIREFVPLLKNQACPSHILNTVSMGALVTLPYSGIYYMTKAAALSLSETLYLELQIEAPHVGVTALCPEFIRTNISTAERNRPATLKASTHPMKDLVLGTLKTNTESDEAISPQDLAVRAFKAISEKRLYAIAEPDNPWFMCMDARFAALRQAGNPPFMVPNREGVANLA